jgi:hypothetical protein
VGTGGLPASGGAPGSGGVGGVCFPSCITDLAGGCPAAGTCTTQAAAISMTTDSCWTDGTKSRTTKAMSGNTSTTTIDISGPVVGPCYSVEITQDVPLTTTHYAWKQGASIAASATVSATTPNLFTIQCNATTYHVDTNSAACQGHGALPTCSIAGSCSY